MAKRQVFWVQDSSGKESVHLNGTNLSFDASYLGHVARIGAEWFFVERDVTKPHGPYESWAGAKRAALRVLDATYV